MAVWRRSVPGEHGATTLEYGVMTLVLIVAVTFTVIAILKA